MLSNFEFQRIKARFQSGEPTFWIDVKTMIDEIERLRFENEQLKETLRLESKINGKNS